MVLWAIYLAVSSPLNASPILVEGIRKLPVSQEFLQAVFQSATLAPVQAVAGRGRGLGDMKRSISRMLSTLSRRALGRLGAEAVAAPALGGEIAATTMATVVGDALGFSPQKVGGLSVDKTVSDFLNWLRSVGQEEADMHFATAKHHLTQAIKHVKEAYDGGNLADFVKVTAGVPFLNDLAAAMTAWNGLDIPQDRRDAGNRMLEGYIGTFCREIDRQIALRTGSEGVDKDSMEYRVAHLMGTAVWRPEMLSSRYAFEHFRVMCEQAGLSLNFRAEWRAFNTYLASGRSGSTSGAGYLVYRTRQLLLDVALTEIRKRRGFILDHLHVPDDPDIQLPGSEGEFLRWVDWNSLEIPEGDIDKRNVEEYLVWGSKFGLDYQQNYHQRLTTELQKRLSAEGYPVPEYFYEWDMGSYTYNHWLKHPDAYFTELEHFWRDKYPKPSPNAIQGGGKIAEYNMGHLPQTKNAGGRRKKIDRQPSASAKPNPLIQELITCAENGAVDLLVTFNSMGTPFLLRWVKGPTVRLLGLPFEEALRQLLPKVTGRNVRIQVPQRSDAAAITQLFQAA